LKPLFDRLTTPRAMVVRTPDRKGDLAASSVKVISIDAADLLSIVYNDAWIESGQDVQVGEKHSIPIKDIGEVQLEEETNYLNLIDYSGDTIMQIQMETSDEAMIWQNGLALLKQVTDSGSEEYEAARQERDENLAELLSLKEDINAMQRSLREVEDEEVESSEGDQDPREVPSLNQQQSSGSEDEVGSITEEKQAQQIMLLLQVNEQKENTIQRLTQRLEHSLEMLKAVHEMYDQQKSVVQAQQRVIEELKSDSTQPAISPKHGSVKSATMTRRPQTAIAPRTAAVEKKKALAKYQKSGSDEFASMDDLLALLKQVDVLKKSVDGLQEEVDGDDEPGAEETELKYLGKNLRALETEKAAMQSQLLAAQKEQGDMVSRLTEMKTMMETLERSGK